MKDLTYEITFQKYIRLNILKIELVNFFPSSRNIKVVTSFLVFRRTLFCSICPIGGYLHFNELIWTRQNEYVQLNFQYLIVKRTMHILEKGLG